MNVNYFVHEGKRFAETEPGRLLINETGDILDLMGNCHYNEATAILLYKENLPDEFFELRSGIAGEILQKFSNYGLKLAIIGDFKEIKSKSLRDFIYECNKNGSINFAESKDDALTRLR